MFHVRFVHDRWVSSMDGSDDRAWGQFEGIGLVARLLCLWHLNKGACLFEVTRRFDRSNLEKDDDLAGPPGGGFKAKSEKTH